MISAKDLKGPSVAAHRRYSDYPMGGISDGHLHRIIRQFCLQRLYFGEGYKYPSFFLRLGTMTQKEVTTIVESSKLKDLSPYLLKLLDLQGIKRGDLDLHFHQSNLILPSILERAPKCV